MSLLSAARHRVVSRREAVSRSTLAGVAVVVASLAMAGPAIADPDRPPPLVIVPAECEGLGTVDVVASSGASVWIGDQHYLIATIDFGGGNVRDFGNRAGFDAVPIFCRSLSGSGITATFVAVPGP